MHILVTNDDGVTAPGLLALTQAMRAVGRVTVLAPNRNWSASGHVKTLHRPLRVRAVTLADGTSALTSDGAPSDCVALALLGVLPDKVDLVVSGINPHPNLGHDLTYSGTVAAAVEAVIGGVPGIAFSLDTPEHHSGASDYAPAAQVAQHLVERLISKGLSKNLLLNVNVPYLSATDMQGWKITRQGIRIYRDVLDARHDPRGNAYYWIGGEVPTGIVEDGTDFGALKSGFVSITPLHLDLTAHQMIKQLQGWLED